MVESQALHGGVQSCSAAAAVDLLWGLAVAGALLLQLWDALAIALDKPGVGLTVRQLQQVRLHWFWVGTYMVMHCIRVTDTC